MRSVEDQQIKVTAAAVAPRPVRVAISEAPGLLCAEDVVAPRPLPGFDQAAIDGYAVRSVDVASAGADIHDEFGELVDLTLPVIGEVPAGSRQPIRLQPRQAVRIDTGAPLPTLADAVLPLDFTDGGRSRIKIYESVRSGDYVRRTGDDVGTGDVAVRAGSIIGPAQVGLLAAVGQSEVLVHPRPRMAVLSVGPELVDIDATPGSGQAYDVNSYALAAAGRDAGAEVHRFGVVDTDPRRLRELVDSQLPRSEIVIIAGAVSGRTSERVCDALADLGELEIARVAMHPGAVQGFGRLGRDEVPTFLLPANPVGALVVFEVMVRPLIRIALGRRQPMRRIVRARTISPIQSISGRKGYLRAQLMRDEATGEYLVQPLGGPGGAGSQLLATMAEANSLIVVDPDATAIRTGDKVRVAFLAQRG